ncbi:MAG TPA: hypothetical protein VHN77_04660 [Phycisphaerales bacterium]|nr:hypothetical protein [Phycisphaerales bacterium]
MLTLAILALACANQPDGTAPPPTYKIPDDARKEIESAYGTMPTPKFVLLDAGQEPRITPSWKNKVGDSKVYRLRREPQHDIGNESLRRALGDIGLDKAEEVEFSAQVTSVEPDGTLVIATTILKSSADEPVSTGKDAKQRTIPSTLFQGRRGDTGIVRIPPPSNEFGDPESRDLSSVQPASITPRSPAEWLRSQWVPAESIGAGAQWRLNMKFPKLSFMSMTIDWSGVAQNVTEEFWQFQTQTCMTTKHSTVSIIEGDETPADALLMTMGAAFTTRYLAWDGLPEWSTMDMVITANSFAADNSRNAPKGPPERDFVSFTLTTVKPPESAGQPARTRDR